MYVLLYEKENQFTSDACADVDALMVRWRGEHDQQEWWRAR